jgi:hypothetical protein
MIHDVYSSRSLLVGLGPTALRTAKPSFFNVEWVFRSKRDHSTSGIRLLLSLRLPCRTTTTMPRRPHHRWGCPLPSSGLVMVMVVGKHPIPTRILSARQYHPHHHLHYSSNNLYCDASTPNVYRNGSILMINYNKSWIRLLIYEIDYSPPVDGYRSNNNNRVDDSNNQDN